MNKEIKSALDEFNLRDQTDRSLGSITNEVGNIVGTIIRRHIVEAQKKIMRKDELKRRKKKKRAY